MIWIFVLLLMIGIQAPGWLYGAWWIMVGFKLIFGGSK